MILFFHGEDQFLVNREKNALQEAFMKKYPTGEVFVFDFEDQSAKEDIKRGLASCESGLFQNQKMIFFLHPSALDDVKEKSVIDFLSQFAEKKSEDTTVCFIEPKKIKKTQGIVKALLTYKDEEKIFPKKETKNTGEYIKKELQQIDAKAHFSFDALTFFVRLMQGDTARIQSELQKLVSYKPGGIFEKEDVVLLVEESKEDVVFEALDALGIGDRGRALFLFHKQASNKDGVYVLLGMCAWQVRRILLVREMIDRGIRRESEIASHTKIAPFVVQKILRIVDSFPLKRAKEGLKLLSDLDSEMKQGKKDPLVALDLFLWKF